MKRLRDSSVWAAGLAAFAALAMLGASAQPLSGASWNGEQKQVLEAMQGIPMLLAGDDFEAFARRFHPGWTQWWIGNSQTRDRDSFLAQIRQWHEAGNRTVKNEVLPVAVEVRGDYAFTRAFIKETSRSSAGEETTVGYWGEIIYVRENGEWLQFSASLSQAQTPQQELVRTPKKKK